jgi:hypothetical protein
MWGTRGRNPKTVVGLISTCLFPRHDQVCAERGAGGERTSYCKGMSDLFAGEGGTGKTMAAVVTTRELCLDLLRLDLSQLVSEYIGESAYKLKPVFDAVEPDSAIPPFKELRCSGRPARLNHDVWWQGPTLILVYDPYTVILQPCNRSVVTTSPSWTGPQSSALPCGNTCSQISFNTVTSNGFKT